jgi:hypothetical protein
MTELDQEAWDRWVAFRKAIKKPIKSVSEHAAKLKLSRFGNNQAAVVDQSIANGWQGLFAIKQVKGEKPVKTDKQIEADRQALADANDRSQPPSLNSSSVRRCGRVTRCRLTLTPLTA